MAGGRPSIYESKVKPNLKYIGMLRQQGVSMEEIAVLLKVSRKTLYNHMAETEELLHTIKKSNEILVQELEATLYDMALGKVVRTKEKIDRFGNGKIMKKETTTETLAPNIAALIFSLTNLAPDKWKNKNETTLEENDNVAPSFSQALREQHETYIQ